VNDDFEQWVRRDDSREQQYSARHPISPEMTGAEDLDDNGQWTTHPEYGAVWTPTTVVAGWAPYRYGHWAWVRPWGWTWIDDASWGFAPFHYGRWFYWGSRWCWAPGTYVRRPVYAPAMVAWVGGPHLSVSVSVGQPVGWVPLAPREAYYPAYRVSPVYIKQVNVTHVTVVQPAPSRPVMYANTRVNGGVTVVSSDVLTRRQAVAAAARSADPQVIRAFNNQRGGVVAVAPPTPSNASFAPRAAVPVNPATQPRIAAPGRGGVARTGGDPDDARAGRLQQSSPGDPRGGLGGVVRPSDSPAANRQAAPMVGRDGREGPTERGRAVPQAPAQPSPAPQSEAGHQRLPRPPLSNNSSDNGFRQPAQVMPQPRREADVPGFPAARERDQPRDMREQQRDAREFQPQRQQPQPQVQQVMPQAQPPVQPQRAAPREEQRQERHVDRQVERQRERDDRQDHRRRDDNR
jgi:hypothetical protein